MIYQGKLNARFEGTELAVKIKGVKTLVTKYIFFVALLASSSATRGDRPSVKNLKSDPYGLGLHIKHERTGGLSEVLEKKYIRFITSKNSFDYYISRGTHKGFQYEMASAFVNYLNQKYNPRKNQLKIQFELIPVDGDRLIPDLLAGRGDILAAGLTITEDRKKLVTFAKPYRRVSEVVLTRFERPGVESLNDLSGKVFAVKKSSSYWRSLNRLNNDLVKKGLAPIKIVLVDEQLETENILELVSLGRYDFSVADSNIAEIATEIWSDLHIIPDLVLSDSVPIAWATPPSSDKLLDELNHFMPKVKKGTLFGNVTSKKYYEDFARLRTRIDGQGNGHVSKFDKLFKKYASLYGWDWRLLAALAFQESRFRQNIKNRWGATGIFQIKPSTAKEPYINIPNIAGKANTENNIHAGVKYLTWLKNTYFKDADIPEREKIRFALAAYNAGPGTLLRARKLAKKMGHDPNIWFRHVELAMLALKKSEPVKYVSEINKRFVSYVLYGIK